MIWQLTGKDCTFCDCERVLEHARLDKRGGGEMRVWKIP